MPPYSAKEQKLGVTMDKNTFTTDQRREHDRERQAHIDTKDREQAVKAGEEKAAGNIVEGHKLKEYSTTGAHETK